MPDETKDAASQAGKSSATAVSSQNLSPSGTSNGGQPPEQPLEPGALLAEKYRIEAILGQGGMGIVYKALHLHLGRHVAVKRLLSRVDNETALRFQHEARAAAGLSHPNIVAVHDFGIEDGLPYMVLDYLEGKTLAEIEQECSPMPLSRFTPIMLQACNALDYAHRRGLVHRDLKCSNLMLIDDPQEGQHDVLKVVDFGLAKVMDTDRSGAQNLTKSGVVLGSPLYMSPEQCRGLPLDGRSDIYALGCVMYRTLTGVPPLHGENPLDTMSKHLMEKPAPLSVVNRHAAVPFRLEKLIMQMLEKDPANRPQSMSDVAEALQHASNIALPPTVLPAEARNPGGLGESFLRGSRSGIPPNHPQLEPDKNGDSQKFSASPRVKIADQSNRPSNVLPGTTAAGPGSVKQTSRSRASAEIPPASSNWTLAAALTAGACTIAAAFFFMAPKAAVPPTNSKAVSLAPTPVQPEDRSNQQNAVEPKPTGTPSTNASPSIMPPANTSVLSRAEAIKKYGLDDDVTPSASQQAPAQSQTDWTTNQTNVRSDERSMGNNPPYSPQPTNDHSHSTTPSNSGNTPEFQPNGMSEEEMRRCQQSYDRAMEAKEQGNFEEAIHFLEPCLQVATKTHCADKAREILKDMRYCFMQVGDEDGAARCDHLSKDTWHWH